MRRIVIAMMTTISGLALLFTYHTSTNSGTTLGASRLPTTGGSAAGDPAASDPGAGATDPGPAPTDNPDGQATPSPAAQDGGGDPTPTPTPKHKPKPVKPSGQFTGDTVDTRWGPVQVVIVVKSGKIVGSDVIQIPHDNPRDQEINQVAVPILNQEVLDRQSPSIDGVSGATVTSDGYRQSLQSAFDRAHL
jgi:uncharacterized protein with FMN-binding domain